MAKYQITHACGHTATHQIFGTNVHGERDRKIAYLETRDCQECYRKKQAEKATEENKDLPALVGSEKQIAWAESIRAAAHKDLGAAAELIKANRDKDPGMADKALAFIDSVLAQSESRYWIDNRAVIFNIQWVGQQVTK